MSPQISSVPEKGSPMNQSLEKPCFFLKRDTVVVAKTSFLSCKQSKSVSRGTLVLYGILQAVECHNAQSLASGELGPG